MKIKTVLEILIILLLCFVGSTNAQQGKDNPIGNAESLADSYSYMGGKEHYLPDSPYYMAGKEQYLQNSSSSKNSTTNEKNNRSPALNGERTFGQSEKSENEGANRPSVVIIVVPEVGVHDYGIIVSPPLVRPRHHKGALSPPPITENSNPGVTGEFRHRNEEHFNEFHQGLRNFR
jgi:hypothetical protein